MILMLMIMDGSTHKDETRASADGREAHTVLVRRRVRVYIGLSSVKTRSLVLGQSAVLAANT